MTVVPSCGPSVPCASMTVQPLVGSLMTPQASHRRRVVEMNIALSEQTRVALAKLVRGMPSVIAP
jgi:hypothetical protein